MSELVDHRLRGAWTPEGSDAAHLPAKAVRWLTERIGNLGAPAPGVPSSGLPVPESSLAADARTALIEVVGAAHVQTDRADRLGVSGGLSYLDLLHRRHPGELAVPDAVVQPADPDEVQRVLDVCVRFDIAVVPFGGGTSVVGGVRAVRGDKAAVVVLDLMRLDRPVSVDPVSRIAVLQAGVRGPRAEELLAEHGFTLGHISQSHERATIGGFAATRSAGQASSGYGRFEDMVTGVRLATPSGEWRLGVAPASAAGPDLRQLAVGSEGALGVLTEVGVRVRQVPQARLYQGFVLDGWAAAAALVRQLAQSGVLADVSRLSDEDETEVSLSLSGGWKTALVRRYLKARGISSPCLLVLGWEAQSTREIALRRAETVRRVRAAGGLSLGRAAGESWRRGRFNGPRQRDALLDLGVCVETLETAAHWSSLDALRDAVRSALRASFDSSVVMCHISHAYETGASLYFTVLAARSDEKPEEQWSLAKAAACEAITGLGTISHHHAVGMDHAPYLGAEIGEIGLSVLAAAKSAVDPTGIMNPGKLLAG